MPAEVEWILKWDKPITYTCNSCGTVATGALSGGGYFGEPTGPTDPTGWWKRFHRHKKQVFRACSEKCAHRLEIEFKDC